MSKILKSYIVSQVSLIVPDLSPAHEERFRSVMEEIDQLLEKKSKDLEIDPDTLKKTSIEEGFKAGYQQGFELGQKEGFEKGYSEGYKEGVKKGEKQAKEKLLVVEEELKREYTQKLSKLETLLESLAEEKERVILNLDKEILNLALAIAKKLVLKEIQVDKDLTLNLIREALKYVAEGIEIKIKLNPEEMSYLEKEILREINPSAKVVFEPDPGVNKGSFFIETPLGVVDGTLERRWEKLLETLFNHEG